jgi:hypothetical protein
MTIIDATWISVIKRWVIFYLPIVFGLYLKNKWTNHLGLFCTRKYSLEQFQQYLVCLDLTIFHLNNLCLHLRYVFQKYLKKKWANLLGLFCTTKYSSIQFWQYFFCLDLTIFHLNIVINNLCLPSGVGILAISQEQVSQSFRSLLQWIALANTIPTIFCLSRFDHFSPQRCHQ